jgi:hypothetical protein
MLPGALLASLLALKVLHLTYMMRALAKALSHMLSVSNPNDMHSDSASPYH